MSQKVFSLVAKTGEYQNAQGETKPTYESAGKLIQKEDGDMFIILNRTFDPKGVPPNPRGGVILSMFEISKGENKGNSTNEQNNQQQNSDAGNGW